MLLIVTAKVTDIVATSTLLRKAWAKLVSVNIPVRFSMVGLLGTKVLTETGYRSSKSSRRVLNVEPTIHRYGVAKTTTTSRYNATRESDAKESVRPACGGDIGRISVIFFVPRDAQL